MVLETDRRLARVIVHDENRENDIDDFDRRLLLLHIDHDNPLHNVRILRVRRRRDEILGDGSSEPLVRRRHQLHNPVVPSQRHTTLREFHANRLASREQIAGSKDYADGREIGTLRGCDLRGLHAGRRYDLLRDNRVHQGGRSGW